VKQEIIPEQAKVVERIMENGVPGGLSFGRRNWAKKPKGGGNRTPRKYETRQASRAWYASTHQTNHLEWNCIVVGGFGIAPKYI